MNDTKIPVDLHCHSLNSDGAHSVEFVLDLAKKNGGKYIALTDHDTVTGIAEARKYARDIGLVFISGVEISVSWDDKTLVHIVGLDIDETNRNLVDNLAKLRSYRLERGQKIADKLSNLGIPDALEGALKYCAQPSAISRTHFARFLIENGYAKQNRVFDKFLGNGAPAYVEQNWAKLEHAVSWIKDSGGVAVIAHPVRYRLTRTKLQKLIDDFKACGGLGIEVVSSSHDDKATNKIGLIANQNNLLASVGSDFHNIGSYPRLTVGINRRPPDFCRTIFGELGIYEN